MHYNAQNASRPFMLDHHSKPHVAKHLKSQGLHSHAIAALGWREVTSNRWTHRRSRAARRGFGIAAKVFATESCMAMSVAITAGHNAVLVFFATGNGALS